MTNSIKVVTIKTEELKDLPIVRKINEAAFGKPHEANIVDNLRKNCSELLSLVAVEGKEIVGHILFSPAEIEGPQGKVRGMGLAPVAVLPERQKQGIGKLLINEGLARLRNIGCPFVIVLGHPEYYPKFGFEPASKYDINCQWANIPNGVFRINWLDTPMERRISGLAKYREEFS
ncbi:MAG: N-acetyltransferase [Candidatus Riflebacteria bacterium]|nr:N-acetyltransferase [Candidatus Riflebacteria bacterium]